MPCFQSNTISVDFEAGSIVLLKQAAAKIGLTVTMTSQGGIDISLGAYGKGGTSIATIKDGKATVRQNYLPTLNALRVAYSKEVVGHVAQKLGWQKVAKSENRVVLRKGF